MGKISGSLAATCSTVFTRQWLILPVSHLELAAVADNDAVRAMRENQNIKVVGRTDKQWAETHYNAQ